MIHNFYLNGCYLVLDVNSWGLSIWWTSAVRPSDYLEPEFTQRAV